MTTLYDFTAKTITGKDQVLEAYRGDIVLVVKTASHCGLTPQFGGLEELYRKLKDEGVVILGDAIKWNFTKFLVGRDGRVIRRYAPTVAPSLIEADVRQMLAADRA